MTYYRNYVLEQLEIIKVTMGDSFSKFDEPEIIEQITSELTPEIIDKLNVPLIVNKTDKKGNCKASLKNIHVGVFNFKEIPFIRARIDEWLIDEGFTITECIDMLRAEYVNERISNGMKTARLLRKYDELESEMSGLGFKLSLSKWSDDL